MCASYALLCLLAGIQEPEASLRDGSPVHYRITPVPGHPDSGELVELQIAMRFTGSPSGSTEIRLPRDYYGTPRLHEFVHDIRASGGITISQGSRPEHRLLGHEPGEEVTWMYTITFDPTEREGSAYRPSVSADHFHFLGPQWQARIEGEGAVEREFTFEFADLPPGWTAFGSFGVGKGPHRMRTSWDDLVTTVLGGGEYAHDAFRARNQPVHTFVRGGFRAGTDRLVESIRRIVSYQRDFFQDDGEELLVVTMTPREGITAGTSIHNAMICYADTDRPLSRLQILLAHEMFHQWLPNRGQVDPGSFEERFDWMNEGFTDYFGRRLLLDQELMTEKDYRDLFNADLRELARNPYRSMTNGELEEVHRTGPFTNVHYRLSYLRGALIALHWDATIRRESDRSLRDAMRELMARAVATGGILPEDDFYTLMESHGVDARADVERWIERALPIVPAADAFGPRFRQETVSVDEPGKPSVEVVQYVSVDR